MQSSEKTEVLVVGAGPVGMFTALRLARHGINVRIIDQETRTAGHSYACALHPSSLALLDEAGIAADAIEPGCRIDRVGYFQGANRELEMKLANLTCEFPFVLVLPQSGLEDLLEERLKQLPNVKFDWHQRLRDVHADESGVTATIEKLASTGRGLIVPEFEVGVEKEIQVRADFLIGADGHASIVRRRLGIQPQRVGEAELFVVYEVETDAVLDNEVKVALDETTGSVMWPLGENRCRWSFQLVPADPPWDSREKDRSRIVVVDGSGPDRKRLHLEKMLTERAPWFKAKVTKIVWSTDIQFDHWSAAQFGHGRCWLAGDAAHQTGPVGMHSMNIGLSEGADLAGKLKKVLRGGTGKATLEAYDRDHRTAWEKLLGVGIHAKASGKATAWAKKNCARIIATLPLSGKEMNESLDRVGISF